MGSPRGLPQRLDGLSIIHLSDLHLAPCFQRSYFEAVFEAVAGWEADLVLFTGDLIDHDSTLGWIVPLMSACADASARTRSWAIMT